MVDEATLTHDRVSPVQWQQIFFCIFSRIFRITQKSPLTWDIGWIHDISSGNNGGQSFGIGNGVFYIGIGWRFAQEFVRKKNFFCPPPPLPFFRPLIALHVPCNHDHLLLFYPAVSKLPIVTTSVLPFDSQKSILPRQFFPLPPYWHHLTTPHLTLIPRAPSSLVVSQSYTL